MNWGTCKFPVSAVLPALQGGFSKKTGVPLASPTPPFCAMFFYPREWKGSWAEGNMRRNDKGIMKGRTGSNREDLDEWLVETASSGVGFGVLQNSRTGEFWVYTTRQCADPEIVKYLYRSWVDYRSRDTRKPGDRHEYKDGKFHRKVINTDAWYLSYQTEKAEDRGELSG